MRAMQIVMVLTLLGFTAPATVLADKLDMPAETVASSELKADISKPYIVKKGDTLWDIADHFFKDPWKWLKIWERNLYITNPDLIYPGNEIWFDGRSPGGIAMNRPQPEVVIKPVERLEGVVDNSIMMSTLIRQDFVSPEEEQGMGHLLDSQDDRINFGVHDRVYVKLNQPAKPGDRFDVFRTTDELHDPESGEKVGVLVEHLGLLRVISEEGGVHRAVVEKSFEEISRTDRLKPARDPNLKIEPTVSDRVLAGKVLYIRDDARAAGQHQVLGISLGKSDGIKAGMTMSIYQGGRIADDQVSGEEVPLPEEKVGELIVLVAQDQASMALISSSVAPIHIGDAVRSSPRP